MARTFVAASSQKLLNANAVLTAVPLTMACWFKPASSVASPLISIDDGASTTNFFLLRAQASGVIQAIVPGTSGSLTVATVTNGVWAHAGAVFASSTSRTAYLNGVAATADTASGTPTGLTQTQIGALWVSTQFANGDIAEAAIWNIALSAADLAVLALGVSPLLVHPEALVFYAPVMGQYSPEIDLFGHKDLTVTGATAATHPRMFLVSRPRRAAFAKAAAVLAADGTLTFSASASFALHAGLAAAGTLTFAAAANLAVGAARFAANGTLTFAPLGDLAAGVRPTTVLAWLAGRQAHMRDGTLSIQDTLNAAPNTATATLDTVAPVGGQPVIIGVGTLGDPARLIFAGEVLTVDQTYVDNPVSPLWPVTLIDYTFALNRRRPFGTYVNVSATTIAQAVIAAYAPGFTAVHVQAALPPVSIIFDGSQDFGTCLQALATAVGGYYGGPDYTKDLWLFLADVSAAPDPIDLAHPILNDPPMTVSTDYSQLRTRVYGKGHAEAVPTDVLAAETIVPLANAVMFNAAGGRALAGTTSAGAQSQIILYTGIQLGGGGSLVGPGAAPSTAPALALVPGTGLGTGVYEYAYTDVTAAGESLPSPLASITTGVLPPPVSAPGWGGSGGGALGTGFYTYAYSFVTAAGETTPSPTVVIHDIAGQGNTITGIAVGPTGVTARKVYRTVADGAALKLLATIADNTTTTYADVTVADGSLGAAAPVSNTATAANVALSAIAIGAATVTSRKLYRTVVGGSQLKLQQTIANNTATVGVQDATADGSLGANVPTSDTSGLTQPSGQVNAGSTSLLTASGGPFSASGGWAILGGGQVVRYTGITGNTLTGIPATGPGAITTTVLYGGQVLPAPALTGVTGLSLAMATGTPVSIWVQRDDLTAQAVMAALEGGDGIHEFLLEDGRRGETSLAALCDANLTLYSRGIVTVTYQTRDLKTKSGKPVHIDLPANGAAPAILGDFTIQQATITIDGPALMPRFAVSASSVRFSLDDLLRRALLVAA